MKGRHPAGQSEHKGANQRQRHLRGGWALHLGRVTAQIARQRSSPQGKDGHPAGQPEHLWANQRQYHLRGGWALHLSRLTAQAANGRSSPQVKGGHCSPAARPPGGQSEAAAPQGRRLTASRPLPAQTTWEGGGPCLQPGPASP